ncbi:MAG TPA: MFS transporter [Propionibacterium sp.]|nr:MFS transporter [Propionibacterium sp.]
MTQSLDWRRIAVAAYVPTLLVSTGHGAVLPLVALTARDMGASLEVAAFLVALFGFGQLIGDIPAGMIASRFGEKRALVGAALLEAAALLLCWQASEVWMLGIGVFAAGLAGAVIGLARQAYLTEVVPAHQRARALSTLGGVYRIGQFLGPMIGALVVATVNLSAAYAAAAAFSVVAAALTAALPDVQGRQPRGTVRGPGMVTIVRSRWKALATLGMGGMVIQLGRAARLSVLPLWAEAVGLSPETTALIFALAALADMSMFYPSGWIMDRFGRFYSAVPTLLVLGIGFATLPLTRGALTVTLVAILLGVANGFSAGIVMTLGSDSAPVNARAKFLGAWRLLTDAGNAGGPLLVSAIVALAPLWSASVAIGAVCWLGAAWFTRWLPRRPGAVRMFLDDETGPGTLK